MMSPALETLPPSQDNESDYGDISPEEREILEALLEEVNSAANLSSVAGNAALKITDIEDYEEPCSIRLSKTVGVELWEKNSHPQPASQIGVQDQTSVAIEPFLVDVVEQERRAQRDKGPTPAAAPAEAAPPDIQAAPDMRSPLLRFRTAPKKALSVTDLVSPAWCELQYFYTLSKHGRKRATPAMRQGTKVHKKLEEEVHTTVPVQITIKEDSWGLRIWNIIQGLKTLRETGRTRELEVWGVVDGQMVNGVIDELSYECPDPSVKEAQANGDGERQSTAPTDGQKSITEYLASTGSAKTISQLGVTFQDSLNPSQSEARQGDAQAVPDQRRIYITDVKTRGARSLPSTIATRPTEVQLGMYFYLLNSLALGGPPLSLLAERYNFNPSTPFSDSFVAQLCSLNDDILSSQPSQPHDDTPSSQASALPTLLEHNTISSLWDLMLAEFRSTLLDEHGKTRISPLLTATYIHSSTSQSLGSKHFQHSPAALEAYLQDAMKWWRGERPARGVGGPVECQAKCRWCEFKEGCEWLGEREREVWEQKGLGVGGRGKWEA